MYYVIVDINVKKWINVFNKEINVLLFICKIILINWIFNYVKFLSMWSNVNKE